jgi:hypothetical protein
MPEKNSKEYDGIYFTPGDEDGELMISYWNFKIRFFTIVFQNRKSNLAI